MTSIITSILTAISQAPHLAIILTVAEPAHPVAALNVATWIEGLL
jgi:hypothetical protein